ncbi:MAG: hypothetical protein AAFX85_03040 [Pseudomonadota bacterium]
MTPTLLAIVIGVGLGLLVATARAPRLTSVLFWLFLSAVLVTAAAVLMVPGAFRDKVFWLSMGLPFTWVAFQFWLYWDRSRWRVTGVLVALALASAVVVAIVPSPV